MNPFAAMQGMQQAANAMNSGSPAILRSVARVWGLGENEIQAITNDGIPSWAIVLLSGIGGVLIGIAIQRRYPKATARIW